MSQYLKAALQLSETTPEIQEAVKLAQTAYYEKDNGAKQIGLGWTITPLDKTGWPELLKVIPMTAHKRIPIPMSKISSPDYNPHALIEKTGATDGFRAYIGIIPEQRIGVVILTNRFIFDSYAIEHAGREMLYALHQ